MEKLSKFDRGSHELEKRKKKALANVNGHKMQKTTHTVTTMAKYMKRLPHLVTTSVVEQETVPQTKTSSRLLLFHRQLSHHFHRDMDDDTDVLTFLKIVIIGESGVGK